MEMIDPVGGPICEVIEDWSFDIVEEAAFKDWLDTKGVTPNTFVGKTDQEAREILDDQARQFHESGARDLCHVAAMLAPEDSQGN